MRTPKLLLSMTGLCLVTSVLTAGAATARTVSGPWPVIIFAAPDGSGTACDIRSPCSLAGAKARVEQLNQDMTADIDVYLFGGSYRLGTGLQFGPADSGSNGYQVIWRAVPGQHPVISGAVRVTGFTESDPGLRIWRAPVPAASAAAGGQQLFVDGQRAQLAQSAGSPPGVQVTAAGFSTTDPAYASFTNQSQIEVVDNSDWKHESCPVQSITPAPGGGSDINLLPSCWDANNLNVPNLGFPFNGSGLPAMSSISYLENAYQLLTQPGQFYLDKTGGYLYYIPRPGQDMATADVELPVTQSLLTLQGTPGHLSPVNQNAAGASYSGSSWQDYTNRNVGDLGNDVEAATANGDSVTYAFTGTGLEVLAETYSDEGSFNAYVDGTPDTRQPWTENSSGGTRLAQQVIYSVQGLAPGPHTVQLVKTGGTYFTIDGFVTTPDALDPVHGIAFDGIGFEYSTWDLPVTTGYLDNQAGVLWDTSAATTVPVIVPAAVTVSRGSGITFAGDTFEHLGATGLAFADGTQNSAVTGSTITDTAGGGVSAGEVDDYFQTDPALMTAGDTISGNVISYVGQDYSDTVGIWAGYTRDLTIKHNDIGHTPYSGLSIGWGWGYASPCSMQAAQGLTTCEHGTSYAGGNQVLGNYVHDVMNTLYDGGPIYTNGGQGEDGAGIDSVLAGNYVAIANHTNNMLYQDEGSSYWHTYGNVVNFAGGGTWIGMWTPTINNITVGPANYSSTASVSINGTDITYTPPTVVSGGAWPPAARAIMNAAGPRPRPVPAVYDDDNQALSYTGDWTAAGTPADQGDTHRTSSQGASVTLPFTGHSIAFAASEGPANGQARISIDGHSHGQVDTYAPFDTPDQTVFTDTTLPPGEHTITVTDASSAQLTVGSFQVPAQPSIAVRTPTPYPAAGSTITVTAKVSDPGPLPLLRTSVTLLAPAGWTASQPVDIGTVPPGRTRTATFTVTPPAAPTPGAFSFTAVASYTPPWPPGQQTLVGSTEAETPYGSLAAAFDNTGVSADSDTGAADLDGSGYSFPLRH